MIVKRIKAITSMRSAVAWVQNYIEAERKHKREDHEELGTGIGKKYFTSRPAGAVTAHGYAKRRVNVAAMARKLKGNDAVLGYFREHCRQRQIRRKKVLGFRLVMSLDPVEAIQFSNNLVDIDRLFVRAIEDTFTLLQDYYYPGDRFGYLVGIDHHGVTKAPDKPARPHIDAHVFVLPQTEKRLRISLSQHAQRGRDGQSADLLDAETLLDAIHMFYKAMVSKQIYTPNVKPEHERSKEWVALVKECTGHVVLDMLAGPKMEPAKARKLMLDKFSYYASSSDRETIRLSYNYWMSRLLAPSTGDPKEPWQDFNQILDGTIAGLYTRAAQHTAALAEGEKEMKPERTHEVKIWEFSPPKALLLKKPANLTGNRRHKIEAIFDDLVMMRQGLRINMIGELAVQEMKLCFLEGVAKVPEWIETLGEMSSGKAPIPNQDILRGKPVTPPAPTVGTEAVTQPGNQ